MEPNPTTRVLGADQHESQSSPSDNPYEPTEIESLDDAAPPPTETTALLSPPTGRPKIAPRFDNSGAETPPSRGEGSGEGTNGRRKPLRLKISFAVACLLLYVNFSFLILTLAAVNSPFITHNALPAHRGSMFLPIWLTVLSGLANILTLLSFVAPLESPHLHSATSSASAFFALLILILALAINHLRHVEGVLVFVLLGIAIVSLLHSAASALLVERFAPLLVAPTAAPPPPGFTSSIKRFFVGLGSFLAVTLPIILLNFVIIFGFFLLAFTTIIRGFDASLEPQGQLWRVRPWGKRYGGGTGQVSDINGRSYNLHLACRGVEVDPIFVAGRSATGNATSQAVQVAPGKVRRTVLVETEQGVPGALGAEWVMKLLREGAFTSPDFDVRVCFYDRAGYGFSDNSPSSTVPHVVTALTEALERAGEIARLEPLTLSSSDASLDSSAIPSPLARSGFIIVGHGYGALPATLFASLHPKLVHSLLYLSPVPPSLRYDSGGRGFIGSLRFFFVDVLGSWGSELGFRRIWSVLKREGRDKRVLSTEKQARRSGILRSYLQEEAEASGGSDSSVAWNRAKTRYPDRPTFVLSPDVVGHGPYGYGLGEWLGVSTEVAASAPAVETTPVEAPVAAPAVVEDAPAAPAEESAPVVEEDKAAEETGTPVKEKKRSPFADLKNKVFSKSTPTSPTTEEPVKESVPAAEEAPVAPAASEETPAPAAAEAEATPAAEEAPKETPKRSKSPSLLDKVKGLFGDKEKKPKAAKAAETPAPVAEETPAAEGTPVADAPAADEPVAAPPVEKVVETTEVAPLAAEEPAAAEGVKETETVVPEASTSETPAAPAAEPEVKFDAAAKTTEKTPKKGNDLAKLGRRLSAKLNFGSPKKEKKDPIAEPAVASEAPKLETPVDESKLDAEAPKVEEAKVEEPKVEEPVAAVEEPAAAAPVVEEPAKVEEPVKAEEPAAVPAATEEAKPVVAAA